MVGYSTCHVAAGQKRVVPMATVGPSDPSDELAASAKAVTFVAQRNGVTLIPRAPAAAGDQPSFTVVHDESWRKGDFLPLDITDGTPRKSIPFRYQSPRTVKQLAAPPQPKLFALPPLQASLKHRKYVQCAECE